MQQLLVVATPGAWPSRWDLGAFNVRIVSDVPSPAQLEGIDCLAVVPETETRLASTVRAVRAARRDAPLALLLASRVKLPTLERLLDLHDFDGFIDLDWPASVARACLRNAVRQVQVGRNVVEIQRVILEQTRSETASLYDLAARDDLTGIYNRRHFLEVLEREHERSVRQARPYGLVFIDLDDLKQLNTRFGHAAGSKALRELACTMSVLLRTSDVAGRFGGDEFLVFLADCDRTGAEYFAERLLQRLRDHSFAASGRSLSVTASIGLATYPADGTSWSAVLERADEALHFAKVHGKNRSQSAGARAGANPLP